MKSGKWRDFREKPSKHADFSNAKPALRGTVSAEHL